jgi:hypothetical protein
MAPVHDLSRPPKKLRSVPREEGATPAIVDLHHSHIHVSTGAVGASQRNARRIDEGHVVTIQEDVIVFETNRPVRSETDLDASSCGSTPPRLVTARRNKQVRGIADEIKTLVDNRSTALGVQQDVVPGMPQDEADRFRAQTEERREQAAKANMWNVRLGMDVYESIIPAAVTPMVPVQRRASVFGFLTVGYGVFWFLGSAVIGILYDLSVLGTVAFCVIAELAAVPFFVWVGRHCDSRVGSTESR